MTPNGLRDLAARCDTLAGQLAASPALVTAASTWQSSTTAVNTVTASTGNLGKKLANNMRATGAKVEAAASQYESTDGQAGAAVGAVGASIPGASAVGGAGG